MKSERPRSQPSLQELLKERERLWRIHGQRKRLWFQLDINASRIPSIQAKVAASVGRLATRLEQVEQARWQAEIPLAEEYLQTMAFYKKLRDKGERLVERGVMSSESLGQIEAAYQDQKERPKYDLALRLDLEALAERQRKEEEERKTPPVPVVEKPVAPAVPPKEKIAPHSVKFNPVGGKIWVNGVEKEVNKGTEAIVLWQLAQKGKVLSQDLEQALREAGSMRQVREIIHKLRQKIDPDPKGTVVLFKEEDKSGYQLKAKDFVFCLPLPDGQILENKSKVQAWCLLILTEAYSKDRQKVSLDNLAEKIFGTADRITRRRVSDALSSIGKTLPSDWEVRVKNKFSWLKKAGEEEPEEKRSAEGTAVLTAVSSYLLNYGRLNWEDLQRKLRHQILTDPQRHDRAATGGWEYRLYTSQELIDLYSRTSEEMAQEAGDESQKSQWSPAEVQLWEQINKLKQFKVPVKRRIRDAVKDFYKGEPEIKRLH